MINIIGAGPAGNYSAYLLAKAGKEVKVFEEHNSIGEPVQCTGITTGLLKNVVNLKKNIVLNEIKQARIYSPDKKFVEINFKEKNLIIDRKEFDIQLSEMALKEGAKYFLNRKFVGLSGNSIDIKDKKNGKRDKIEYDHLIGADGPLSAVAKSCGLFKKRKFWQGIQARVKMKNDNVVEFYPYFGTYAWVVPENKEIVRIGLVGEDYANVLFKNFLFKFKKIEEKDVIEYQGGLIPIYNPFVKTKKDTIYIVGDAAGQVKATTGGGVIQGLMCSKALCDSIVNHKNYGVEWRKLVGKELYIHLKARKIMDKFKDKDWNKLIKIINSGGKEILESEERDNISKLMFKLILKNPGLVYFMKCML